MSFPVSPYDGQIYQTPYGARYRYSSVNSNWQKESIPLIADGATGAFGATKSIIHISWASSIPLENGALRIHNGVVSDYGYYLPITGRVKSISYSVNTMPVASKGFRLGLYVNEENKYTTDNIIDTSSNFGIFDVDIPFFGHSYLNVYTLTPSGALIFDTDVRAVVVGVHIEVEQNALFETGFCGLTGAEGITGYKGITGFIGLTGAQDQNGIKGITGFQGITGVQGIRSSGAIFLSAEGGFPSTSNGCGLAEKIEYTTNDVDFYVLPFDSTSIEYAQWSVPMPSKWNGGYLTASFYWTAGSGSGGVRWGIAARSFSDSSTITSTYGTAVEVTDTLTAVDDLCVSSETSIFNTASASPSGKDLVQFRVYRDPTNGADTLSSDARLIGVKINFSGS